MKIFPKKYTPQDLKKRSKLYKSTKNNSELQTYTLHILPTNKKIECSDLFLMYIKDFYNLHPLWNSTPSNNLFLFFHNDIQSLNNANKFFNKKKQTLQQVWIHKLNNYIISQKNKKIIANNKIVESYFSSPYKIYLENSELYLYVLKIFKNLRESWKITVESNIWYRSFNLQTSISENNIIRKEEEVPNYIIKYFIWSKAETLPVCIKDIDLCCGDVALLVHPKDKRYNKYIGKNAIIPLCNRQIPIIWDENVNITLNNWIKRICPCSDQESIELAKKYWLPTDIYVFNKKWVYNDYIHESAFIWQERKKYYDNIIRFLIDISNLDAKEITYAKDKVPYLKNSDERLIPYKMDQLILNLKEEKESLIDQIFKGNINISFINPDFDNSLEEIKNLKQQIKWLEIQKIETNEYDEINNNLTDEIHTLQARIHEIEQPILDKLNKLIPDKINCNNQTPIWRKIPLLKNKNWWLSFRNIEEDYKNWKWDDLQKCFNFVILSLIREWIIWEKWFWWEVIEETFKLCEYEKLFVILSENELKIEKIIEVLQSISWNQSDYKKLINIIQNLTDETNSSIDECSKLIDNSEFLQIDKNVIYLKQINGIINDVFDPDFIQNCIFCYLEWKQIYNNQTYIIDKKSEKNIFNELIFQELILWKFLNKNILEHCYDKTWEKIFNKEWSSPLQIEQSKWDIFSLYWENPVRLCLLTNYTYDEQEILLNNIFLKQIRNAVRLCIQKWFLPSNYTEILNNNYNDLDDLDLSVLNKLKELYEDFNNIKTFEEYIVFFKILKNTAQDLFFSRYLEFEKLFTTKNVQFTCAYFFNFLFNTLYPLVPQYVEALIYMFNDITGWNFQINTINQINFSKTTDYNINILYDTFIKIKHARLDLNIKQHEPFNLFFKSTPSLLDTFWKYEQIFKNYFHISEILYIRLHEPNPLWYEIISDDLLSIGIQTLTPEQNHNKSKEFLEKELKDLKDKADLIRERMQLISDSSQLEIEKENYEKIKEEMDNLTIQIALMEK